MTDEPALFDFDEPEPEDEPPRPPRFPRLYRHGPPVALALAVATVLVMPATAAFSQRVSLQDTPQATVRDFLVAAVVDHDGVTAARYETAAARVAYEGPDQRLTSDEIFFGGAELRLGGTVVDTERQLVHLRYRVLPDGADRIVVVAGHGAQVRFRVAPVTQGEQIEFQAPRTDWRIDAGVTALAAPGPAAVTAI